MADRGIIFSAPMVLGLLAGRKFQTRRLIEPCKDPSARPGDILVSWPADAFIREGLRFRPPHAVGDRLYVRETCCAVERATDDRDGVWFPADEEFIGIENSQAASIAWLKLHNYGKIPPAGRYGPNVPSIHMPRWASRLWLLVKDVRVQRLQDICEADAIAEGIELQHADSCPIIAYATLWDLLHREPGTRWADNPWIYCLTWPEVNKGNIDASS